LKLGRSKIKDTISGVTSLGKPAKNSIKNYTYLLVVLGITIILIFWVYTIGAKAERTVKVAMLATNVYKNQLVTKEMFKPYDMLQGEFEKYAIIDNKGRKVRRIILWNEIDKIVNSFAAYPLQEGTYAEYRSFIKSRVDNSDNVLYSFPGKEIVPLEIGANELQAFKTFLQPGDRLTIEAIFSQRESANNNNDRGNTQVEVFRTENVFTDIMVADLLNAQGESILDIYSSYRDKPVYEQAQLDTSQAFRDRTEPKTLLVALTPEEKDRYYYYLSKSNVKFRVSMPQRVE